jgi:aryl-alcohol dehydrogenase-like predicted oxidoreductase
MRYRRLGRAGLQVSELSLGSWITYANQVNADAAVEMMAAAFDAGVNFFDNAEAYAGGRSEVVMGEALRRLGWPRLNYVCRRSSSGGLRRRQYRQPQEHAEPQVPDAGHRRLAAALRPRAHRHRVLPPARPEHARRERRCAP